MGKLAVAMIVSIWVIPISVLVNNIVPEAYMDEIFHIPQAQQYCKGNFRSWDPMITTPPGLYYLSLAHVAYLFPGIHLLKQISSFSDLCSTSILRSVNGVLAAVCSILVYEIMKQLRPALSRKQAATYAVVLSLYPLHWFFTYVYYTDVASLASFLAMYLMSLKKKYFLSAMLGSLAICIRQTNVIWLLFVACNSAVDMMLPNQRWDVGIQKSGVTIHEKGRITPKEKLKANPGLRRRKTKGTMNAGSAIPNWPSFSTSEFPGLLDEIQFFLTEAWHLKWKLLLSFSPFLLVLAAFVGFVYWNGSIVLGAKEAHIVSPHFAQILYFGVVTALFSAPLHFTLGRASFLAQSFWKCRALSLSLGIGASVAALISVHFYSIAHPYLLADNRHYPFYIWRKVINAHWLMKYLLVLLYLYSWQSILSFLGKNRSKIWVLAYFLACAAALVPAPLVEFRYYTIPYFIFMLNCGIDETRNWLLMGILYIAINGFTLWMFLFRPFHWAHEAGVQRFIW